MTSIPNESPSRTPPRAPSTASTDASPSTAEQREVRWSASHSNSDGRGSAYSVGLGTSRRNNKDSGLQVREETLDKIDETVSSAFLDHSYFPPCPFVGVALLGALSIAVTAAGPTLLFFFADDTPIWVKIAFASISGLIVLISIPSWMVLVFWKRQAVQTESFVPPAVDIVLTTYKEHIDEVAGSLAACMNIDYGGAMNIYVLDDAGREDVATLCREVGKKNNLQFTVHHVVRRTNHGRKGGNINNWLRSIPKTADFFITLDCDMRPFPNMCSVLFSHYFSLDPSTQRRLAFLQSPQFYRNYRPTNDGYDVCLMHFVKTVLPCLDTLSTVPYIGTSALWKREALVNAGGFVETHATEDVVTGCNVHRTKNRHGENYVSKYVPVPVAAGLSPRTLPELMDQRVRWNVGLVQMTAYHSFFIFARGLGFMQRVAYLATCGGWIANLLLYFIVLGGTLFTNSYLTWATLSNPAGGVASAGPWTAAVSTSFLIPFSIWLALPGTSVMSRMRGIQMAMVYTSTQLVGLFYCLGLPVAIATAAEGRGERRWHPHFLLHGLAYSLVVGSGLAALVSFWQRNVRDIAPYFQVIALILTWTWALGPIFKSFRSFQSEEQPMWLELESGRASLFDRPIFSSLDATAIGQMKELMVTLVNRIEVQENISNRQNLPTSNSGLLSPTTCNEAESGGGPSRPLSKELLGRFEASNSERHQRVVEV